MGFLGCPGYLHKVPRMSMLRITRMSGITRMSEILRILNFRGCSELGKVMKVMAVLGMHTHTHTLALLG